MNTFLCRKSCVIHQGHFPPKANNNLDLAFKSKPNIKRNILLNFFNYCKNVEKAVISIRDIFPQKP